MKHYCCQNLLEHTRNTVKFILHICFLFWIYFDLHIKKYFSNLLISKYRYGNLKIQEVFTDHSDNYKKTLFHILKY